MGSISIADTIKEDSVSANQALKQAGVRQTVMLTGDRHAVAASVAEPIGLDRFHAELLPGDKVRLAEEIIERKQNGKQ